MALTRRAVRVDDEPLLAAVADLLDRVMGGLAATGRFVEVTVLRWALTLLLQLRRKEPDPVVVVVLEAEVVDRVSARLLLRLDGINRVGGGGV